MSLPAHLHECDSNAERENMKSTLYPIAADDVARVAGERQSQRLVTAFVISGLFFMLLPGTFLEMVDSTGSIRTRTSIGIP